MSVNTLDYIPFDYQRYFQEILPAFEQATHGNFIFLKDLLDSATQIAYSVRTRYAVPLSGDESQHFLGNRFETNIASLLNVPTLRRVRAGGEWNPWDALAIVLPTLEGRTLHHLGQYGELLKSFLLATFCCQCPPWSANWSQRSNGPIIPHDEVLFDWQTYITRDEHMQQLWSVFDQPLPLEIISRWPSPEDTQNERHPRAIFYTLAGSYAFLQSLRI
ncbi:MAG TPA: hypothetical protein VN729_13335 [Ktedonobacteraceae bacterium]|nr:hypothetical protein [Ktedonobacteraceae bacterium]